MQPHETIIELWYEPILLMCPLNRCVGFTYFSGKPHTNKLV